MSLLHSRVLIRWGFPFITCIGLSIVGVVSGRSQSVQSFPDVPADHWAFQAVHHLRHGGILQGYPGGQAKSTSDTRPQEKTITFSIEGMQEQMRLHLLDESGLPFSTYYPKDMIADTASSGEGKSVRFIANFGGKRNDKTVLHVFFFRPETTQQEAYSTMRAAVTSRGIRSPRPRAKRQFAWSLREYSLTVRGRGGWIALGNHKGRYFYVINEFPLEYEEGLGPRVEQILKEWQWRDTGRGLNTKG